MELDDVQGRARGLRRRLRELTDRHLALGTVHARFLPEAPAHAERVAASPPLVTEAAAPAAPPAPEVPIEVVRAVLAPPKEETHEELVAALAARYPDGFTVGQMREMLDDVEPDRVHSYDAAWALANNLLRTKAFEVAGSRPGPTGPIRVLRAAAAVPVGEVG